MKQSPVKFDDLAFILLFFFMIVAVLFYSQNAEKKQESKAEEFQEETTQSVEVVLLNNGVLDPDINSIPEGSQIDLKASDDCSWETIRNCIKQISEKNYSITLVI